MANVLHNSLTGDDLHIPKAHVHGSSDLTEADPLWTADKPNYSTTAQCDSRYLLLAAGTNQTMLSGILKCTAGVLSNATVGTDYDNYWTRTGTTLSSRTAGDNILITGTLGAGAGTLTSLNTHTIPAGTGTLALTTDVSGLLSSANTWTNTNNFTGSLVVANSTTYVYYDISNSNDNLNLWRTKSNECFESQLNSVPDEDWASAMNVDRDTYGSDLYADDGTYYSGLGKTNEATGEDEFIGMMWQWELPSNMDETNVKGLYVQVIGYNTSVHSEVKIYNWSTSTWDSVATGTSTSSDNDMNGTITSNVGNYINNNQVSYQVRTKTLPTVVTTMYTDYTRFGYLANIELDDQKWLGDLTVDGNFYVNGTYRPKSLLPLADDTYNLGSALFRWDNVYGVLGRLNDLVVTGSTSAIRGFTIDFYDTNSSRNQVNFEYSSSYNYGTITFFTQKYVSTPNGTDDPQTLYGDNLTYERRTATASSDAITMYGRRSTAYFHPQYLSSNTSTHLIAGGYSQSYGYLDETSAGNMAEKTNFISHIFDIPTFTAGSGTITGTSQKLSWFSQGDAMFASGQKLYFRGTLSGTTLTMDTTEYVNSDADGYLDLHAGTAVRANTGFIIPVGTTPSPAVAGALYVDTDASTNGDLMVYANSGWRKVVSLP